MESNNLPQSGAPGHGDAASRETQGNAARGWKALSLVFLGWITSGILLALGSVLSSQSETQGSAVRNGGITLIVIALLAMTLMLVISFGFFTLQPNEARVLVLFGEYRGTVRSTGFYWANPFYAHILSAARTAPTQKTGSGDESGEQTSAVRSKMSLRARTLNGPKLKVNDKNGNPIEIANVIVWRVVNTAKAVFDVDHYEQYVRTQSETALRHVASLYAYDHNGEDGDEHGQITLRANITEVSQALKKELEQRLEPAGITIDDARLTHLAYAPEIAQVMLRRQQAEAIISARTKIVQGAVSMVDMALKELERDGVITLDDERKASMVSNLMVVLCADNDAQPVINAGTLYS
ncbi:MAG: SPFH domain-containing protein [Bifidobacterium sp.]|jgi:regulator of protease activity HflC (stomatin/prohibitin superfamily)|nr:SPFH domain-containing protein [Bifidobacterium sp.]MCI1865312.1 SPFH domain-containing protein [Bifidobacterium sp.]